MKLKKSRLREIIREELLNEKIVSDRVAMDWIYGITSNPKNKLDTMAAIILNVISQGMSDDVDYKKLGKLIIKHTKTKFGS